MARAIDFKKFAKQKEVDKLKKDLLKIKDLLKTSFKHSLSSKKRKNKELKKAS